MDSARALCIQPGEERVFPKWLAGLLLSYIAGQRPQAGHKTQFGSPQVGKEASSYLLLLSMCHLVLVFRR